MSDLGYGHGKHFMHDIDHSMYELSIIWNVDVCVVPWHVHFRWGVALVGEFNY